MIFTNVCNHLVLVNKFKPVVLRIQILLQTVLVLDWLKGMVLKVSFLVDPDFNLVCFNMFRIPVVYFSCNVIYGS